GEGGHGQVGELAPGVEPVVGKAGAGAQGGGVAGEAQLAEIEAGSACGEARRAILAPAPEPGVAKAGIPQLPAPVIPVEAAGEGEGQVAVAIVEGKVQAVVPGFAPGPRREGGVRQGPGADAATPGIELQCAAGIGPGADVEAIHPLVAMAKAPGRDGQLSPRPRRRAGEGSRRGQGAREVCAEVRK